MQKKPVKKPITPDPGDQTDCGSHTRARELRKENLERVQRPEGGVIDLEKWHESKTH